VNRRELLLGSAAVVAAAIPILPAIQFVADDKQFYGRPFIGDVSPNTGHIFLGDRWHSFKEVMERMDERTESLDLHRQGQREQGRTDGSI
jgi:hypothetical protein